MRTRDGSSPPEPRPRWSLRVAGAASCSDRRASAFAWQEWPAEGDADRSFCLEGAALAGTARLRIALSRFVHCGSPSASTVALDLP